jgi:predicted nuclease of predicted toxin-antitoxin system
VNIRFLADADFNHNIVRAIKRREATLDFRTARQAALAGLKDPQVLDQAAREGRVLVTHDLSSMPRHFERFISIQNSPGIIVVPQHLAISAVADDLILIWNASAPEEWENQITYLPL